MNGTNSSQAPTRHRVSASARALGLLPIPGLGLLVAFAPQPICAQATARPTISVAAAVGVAAPSEAGLAISVGPTGAVPPHSFIRVRGLPPMAALSDAYSISPGVWAVALAALPDLKIILPAGVIGRSDIVIALVALDGTVLAEAKSVLDVAAPRQQQSPRRTPSTPPTASMLRPTIRIETSPEVAEPSGPAPTAAAARPIAPRDRERVQRLMQKGNQELEDGNVSVARLFYERAADAGLAEAAMALAVTFDPNELAKLKVRGIVSNAKEARRWYERARQLGAAEAEQRMRLLSAQ